MVTPYCDKSERKLDKESSGIGKLDVKCDILTHIEQNLANTKERRFHHDNRTFLNGRRRSGKW